MNKVRLLKLADHLENGELGHKDFNMNHINDGEINDQGCGTRGYAIGELPILFPNDWKFEIIEMHKNTDSSIKYSLPIYKKLRDVGVNNLFTQVDRFFDITHAESNILFSPSQHNYNNTRYGVATRIKEFTKLKEFESI